MASDQTVKANNKLGKERAIQVLMDAGDKSKESRAKIESLFLAKLVGKKYDFGKVIQLKPKTTPSGGSLPLKREAKTIDSMERVGRVMSGNLRFCACTLFCP